MVIFWSSGFLYTWSSGFSLRDQLHTKLKRQQTNLIAKLCPTSRVLKMEAKRSKTIFIYRTWFPNHTKIDIFFHRGQLSLYSTITSMMWHSYTYTKQLRQIRVILKYISMLQILFQHHSIM